MQYFRCDKILIRTFNPYFNIHDSVVANCQFQLIFFCLVHFLTFDNVASFLHCHRNDLPLIWFGCLQISRRGHSLFPRARDASTMKTNGNLRFKDSTIYNKYIDLKFTRRENGCYSWLLQTAAAAAASPPTGNEKRLNWIADEKL